MSRFGFVTLCVCASLMGQTHDLNAPGAMSLPVASVGTPASISPSATDGAGAAKPDGTVVRPPQYHQLRALCR